MDGTTPIARMAKIVRARRLITKPRQLFEEVEGRHVAILARRFGEHTFEGDHEATPTADVAVVDVETDPARPVAALSISWRRVVAALRLTEPGTWQVGRLVREDQAVELRGAGSGLRPGAGRAAVGRARANRGGLRDPTRTPGRGTGGGARAGRGAGGRGNRRWHRLSSREPFQRLWQAAWELHDAIGAAIHGPLQAAAIGIDVHAEHAELRLLRDRNAELSDAFEYLDAAERRM